MGTSVLVGFWIPCGQPPRPLNPPADPENGALVQTTWEDALEYVANRVSELKQLHGGQSFED